MKVLRSVNPLRLGLTTLLIAILYMFFINNFPWNSDSVYNLLDITPQEHFSSILNYDLGWIYRPLAYASLGLTLFTMNRYNLTPHLTRTLDEILIIGVLLICTTLTGTFIGIIPPPLRFQTRPTIYTSHLITLEIGYHLNLVTLAFTLMAITYLTIHRHQQKPPPQGVEGECREGGGEKPVFTN